MLMSRSAMKTVTSIPSGAKLKPVKLAFSRSTIKLRKLPLEMACYVQARNVALNSVKPLKRARKHFPQLE